jgi:hypothetical protein
MTNPHRRCYAITPRSRGIVAFVVGVGDQLRIASREFEMDVATVGIARAFGELSFLAFAADVEFDIG